MGRKEEIADALAEVKRVSGMTLENIRQAKAAIYADDINEVGVDAVKLRTVAGGRKSGLLYKATQIRSGESTENKNDAARYVETMIAGAKIMEECGVEL